MKALPLPKRDRAPQDKKASPFRSTGEAKYTSPPTDLIKLTTLAELIGDIRTVIPEQQDRIETKNELWSVGDTSLLQRKCIAIVGTRNVSKEGAARARRLA